MKISIITVCFNSARTLGDTLQSVAAQTHPDIEHIVVDGGSEDGTLAVIKRYRQLLSKVISEPDRGVYDAMNKGIGMATGEVIGFINSDDFYAGNTALSHIAEAFSDPAIEACFGDLVYVDQQDPSRIVRYWKSCTYRLGRFEYGWVPPHPTFFVRRSVYERLGGFNLNFLLAADMELMLRFLEVHRICSVYVPRTLIKMRLGGKTNQSLSNVIQQNREIMAALKQHGLRASWFRLLGHKLWSRGRQFFVHPRT
ncbi:glycosyltransferase family 2 protein [Thiobacillus sp.]|uniref:glycosyltransferase family 2 protein n=1 Tax=Thiobacillus sp. TaxID=924 RepID=UPI0025FEDC75|nr:glycosyltransferase family 2 protein [Thiobacillus sp.]